MTLVTIKEFIHTVSVPVPFDATTVRDWLDTNGIRYTYSTHNIAKTLPTVEFHFIKEKHATLFRLKWL